MSAHAPEPTDRVGTLHQELAAMLGERVERQVVEPMRRVAARAPRLGSATPSAPPVELDHAVVDAITLAVDQSIERLLPGLVEDAVARVLPVAVEAAITDVLETLAPPAATATPPGPGSTPIGGAVAERAAR